MGDLRTPRFLRLPAGLLAAAVLLIALCGVPADAATTVTERFTGELRVGELQLNGKGTGTFAGEFRSRQLADGATIYTTKGEGVVGTRKGRMRIWNKRGRIDIVLKSRFTRQPDGSVRNNGTGRIVGGTGRYRRARGSFVVLAVLKFSDPYTTVRISKGRITFPAI